MTQISSPYPQDHIVEQGKLRKNKQNGYPDLNENNLHALKNEINTTLKVYKHFLG